MALVVEVRRVGVQSVLARHVSLGQVMGQDQAGEVDHWLPLPLVELVAVARQRRRYQPGNPTTHWRSPLACGDDVARSRRDRLLGVGDHQVDQVVRRHLEIQRLVETARASRQRRPKHDSSVPSGSPGGVPSGGQAAAKAALNDGIERRLGGKAAAGGVQ